MWPILTALAVFLAATWVAMLVGELVAWRRGLPSITDTPDLPPRTAQRTLAWWEHALWGAFFVVAVVPIVAIVLVFVAPPVLAVAMLARVCCKPAE
jgi:hypothetical protein